MVFVNAPSFFNVAWKMVKPLIPEAMVERIIVAKGRELTKYIEYTF